MPKKYEMQKTSPFRLAIILLVALFAMTMVGCRTAPIKNVSKMPISAHGASMEDIGKAIKAAGTGLGWLMKERSPGLITGTLSVRSHMAKVEIPYSRTSYSIRYKDSSNLKYSAQNKTIHSNYNGWIQNLDNAIRAQLTML